MEQLLHDRFGAILYAKPVLWMFHLSLAHSATRELEGIHQDVLTIPPTNSNMRSIRDEPFSIRTYGVGNALVSHAIRAVQHLTQEVEARQRVAFEARTCAERVREATSLFTERDYCCGEDYAGFCEINDVRDAMEHPPAVIDPADWARIPLSWILPNRSLDSWKRYERWFTTLAHDWVAYQRRVASPQTVVVTRGMASTHQVKLPPTSRQQE